MGESRTSLSTEELAKTLVIWLKVLGQRRSAVLRDLWTRRDERPDQTKREHAQLELARYLAEQMRLSGYEVTRKATQLDAYREATTDAAD
ncbi:hypothetical protein [Sphingosinicella terrae]|uniref:hypothetical protein n=1 Tax=Sphingosinicella terrae TaxID=2172047 RepID=UPI000E0D115A|nr:hypothetical protein [Sphingosinicella terrae]